MTGFDTKARGHSIDHNGEFWHYADDGTPYDDTRACPECDMTPEYWQAPDPCLERLPGVEWACCGHGGRQKEYVVSNGIKYDSVKEWRDVQSHAG